VLFKFPLQKWAHAYREETYHTACETNNGTESQNKLLKYSYLPKKKLMTVSALVRVLVESFFTRYAAKVCDQQFENLKVVPPIKFIHT